jgi:dephospho-CoA kinase
MSTEAKPRRSATRDGLLLIGLVGRAGSGKSTVARALEVAGAVVIDADQIGHQVTDQDSEVRTALESEYGREVYRPDGTLDRGRVAERVFTDPAARERLDRLVHPRILARIRARLDELRSAGFRGAVVIDAALMLEWGLERELDRVLAVTAPERLQVERLRRARGWSEAEASARLMAQRSNERFAAAADTTLVNDGGVEALEQAARATLRKWGVEVSG